MIIKDLLFDITGALSIIYGMFARDYLWFIIGLLCFILSDLKDIKKHLK